MPVAADFGLEELRQAKQICRDLGLWIGSMMQGEKEGGWSARLDIAPSAPTRNQPNGHGMKNWWQVNLVEHMSVRKDDGQRRQEN